MKLNKILETALYVNNLEEAEKFYVDILGLEVVKRSQSIPARDLFLRCGDTMLLLFNPEETKIDTGVVPTHGTIGQGHMAFGIPRSDFDNWREYLIKNSITIEKEADWEKGTHSIYFRDPSGNSIEFIEEDHWF